MALQTFENDENNRVQIKRKNLKNEIRSTWLGIRDDYRTLIGIDDLSLLQDHYEESEDGGIIYLCNYQKIKNGI